MITEHQELIHRVKSLRRNFLAGYFVGGDPTPDASFTYIKEAVASGMDVIEIGIPSRDPFMDGDVIKRSHKRAYPHLQVEDEMVYWLARLKQEVTAPIWAMGYYSDVIESGLYKRLVKEKVIDGLVIPDLPLHEIQVLRSRLKDLHVSVIPVINNSMADADLKVALFEADIVYCQLYKGKTGSATPNFNEMPDFHDKIRELSDAILMAGFGVKNPEHAKDVFESGFDGVVVGSAIVEIIENQDIQQLTQFVSDLATSKKQ